jgi:hypothetical protein
MEAGGPSTPSHSPSLISRHQVICLISQTMTKLSCNQLELLSLLKMSRLADWLLKLLQRGDHGPCLIRVCGVSVILLVMLSS